LASFLIDDGGWACCGALLARSTAESLPPSCPHHHRILLVFRASKYRALRSDVWKALISSLMASCLADMVAAVRIAIASSY
jgi:hypothetical protein